MELFLYIKTLTLFITLFICGIVIIRRLTEENKAQILIPSGMILGVALYIFLINLVAHFIKGIPGFYFSLLIEIFITVLVKHYIPIQPMEFPKGKANTLVIISLLFWAFFLYEVIATSGLSGDVTYYYSLASLFSRGDYPMHAPWQPDYIMTYHFGGAEFLGAAKSITGASYTFIHLLLAFFMLFSWSQILTWSLIKEVPIKFSSLMLMYVPAFVGLISFGGFVISWPAVLNSIHFDGNIFKWLSQLPTLGSLGFYGAPAVLDMMVVFLHRFLSISFFFCLLSPLILPRRENFILLVAMITVLISSIALTDESVLIATLPAVFFVSFFTLFNKSVAKILPSVVVAILIICLQGGIVTETLFNRQDNPGILIFPKDVQTFLHLKESSYLFKDLVQFQPFRFLHPGIIWQLSLLLLISIFLKIPKNVKFTIWLFFISALTSLIAYHAVVPKLYAENGNRFLLLSYYFSGIGISLYLTYWWLSYNRKLLILRSAAVWVLLFSLLPPLFAIFPRPRTPNLMVPPEPDTPPSFTWIRDNLSVKERILVLTQPSPATIANAGLVTQIGALTPMWDITPRVENVFEMSPLYSDAYFTLNPDTLRTLKINYLIIGSNYLPQLAVYRKQDLANKRYFQPVFIDPSRGETIYKVTPEYLNESQNLGGTLTELAQIAPKQGTYYIEYVPNIPENMFRALRVLLYDRDVYHPIGAAFYNGSINVEIKSHTKLIDNYDFLVLADATDPKSICHCQAKLLWTGLGNGLKLWKTI